MSQICSSDCVGVLASDLCRFAGAPIAGNPRAERRENCLIVIV